MKQISNPFQPLQASNVALLTTFRRSGIGVATPVGIKLDSDKAYFTTWSTTGKVKRLAHNANVTLAPCTRMGKVTGETVYGVARHLDPFEADRVRDRILNRSLWGRMWEGIYKLRGWQKIIYEVSPSLSR